MLAMSIVLETSPHWGRMKFAKIPTEGVGVHSIISEKGQITVPKRLRDRLGIRPGDRLEFSEDRGHIVVSKTADRDPVATVYGILGHGRSTDEALRELRGEADAV
jgi:antitoxin PrlF